MKVSKTKFVVVTIGIMMIFLNYYILAVDIVQLSPGWEYRAGITTVILIVYSLISWRILGLKYASPTFFVRLLNPVVGSMASLANKSELFFK